MAPGEARQKRDAATEALLEASRKAFIGTSIPWCKPHHRGARELRQRTPIRRRARAVDERLIALRSQAYRYWCWGYSFPWQTRTIVVPTGAPNLVCTTFVGNALLDAYEQCQDERCLRMAVSTAEYILDDLYWTDGKSIAGFSYPLPGLRNQVPNASFLGAAFLCRVYKHTSERKFVRARSISTRLRRVSTVGGTAARPWLAPLPYSQSSSGPA